MTDNLPTEVAEAIQMLRGRATYLRDLGRIKTPQLMEQAADHLHRLAEENARLLSIQIGMHRDVCANALRAEEAEARVQELSLLAGSNGMAANTALDRAESERDALKARIAVAGRAECRDDGDLNGPALIAYMAEEDVGRTFAMLKLGDGE